MAMNAFQKTTMAVVVVGAIALGLYQAQQVSSLRDQVKMLRQEQEQRGTLSNQVHELQNERDAALARLASQPAPGDPGKKGTNEVLKLRGEVGRLRRENADIGSSSGLSKVTANPEAKKMLAAALFIFCTVITSISGQP